MAHDGAQKMHRKAVFGGFFGVAKINQNNYCNAQAVCVSCSQASGDGPHGKAGNGMAKYTINYACGHSQDVQLYGPGKERERKIEWLERGDCPECWKAKQAADRIAQNAEAAAQNAGAVSLVGTEKQIAWAESIRRPVLAEIPKMLERMGTIQYSQWMLQARDEMHAFLDKIAAENRAAWWIDNRAEFASGVDYKLVTMSGINVYDYAYAG